MIINKDQSNKLHIISYLFIVYHHCFDSYLSDDVIQCAHVSDNFKGDNKHCASPPSGPDAKVGPKYTDHLSSNILLSILIMQRTSNDKTTIYGRFLEMIVVI